LLTLSDLHVFYGDAHVLHGISLQVGASEAVCVMGPNGAGKSTLLKTVAGVLTPRTGTIELDGARLDGKGPRRAVGAGIVLVPEGRHIFQSMTIRENLLLGAHTRKDRDAVQQDLTLMYELFPVLYDKRDARGREMSGGQQQMLAIARGLMSRPRLLLLDEPSLGLAPIVVNELPTVLGTIRSTLDTAVLIVEQNASLALAVAKRGVIMESGRNHIAGSNAELRRIIERDGLFATTGVDAVERILEEQDA
jgi:branched-chain amino acid transport system ATP-binding protein